MGLFDITLCSNKDCPKTNVDKKLTTCPDCGSATVVLRAGSDEIKALLRDKQKKGPDKAVLISDDMTDDELKIQIQEDMKHLAQSEAGSGWMHLGTILSGNSTDQMLGSGFKALINQNKIIIRQNELVLRALTRMQTKDEDKVQP